MIEKIYFAGGCFWGTQRFFSLVNGVVATAVGYAGSRIANPTYEQVCTGATGAAETVMVEYDTDIIELQLLVELYFQTIDPLSVNRQGNDIGTQYRTGIYYTRPSQLRVIEMCVEQLEHRLEEPLAVEVKELDNFYPAEEYHQRYLEKNPGGYCHILPSMFKIAREANR